MAFSYLEPDVLDQVFNDSKKYMRPLFEPFSEFERIARNRPYPGLDKAYPKVTDGTTASVITKTPRRIFQQLPTGMAMGESNTPTPLSETAGFILTSTIIPNANSQYTFIQKSWNVISKGLTYGSQPTYVPFVNRGKYFGTDMLVPYIKDVFLEIGKMSDSDSNYIFMRSWYQPRDIKSIIMNQSSLKEKGADAGWNLKALADIENSISQKDDLSTTPNEKDRNNRSGGVEIIHCFQRGIGATFYSYHMPTKQVVRTWKNPDPRGEIPIHYFYADTDGSNPLGRGFIEQVGALQNLMDAEMQMYQFNRALMLNPPMIKKGDWNENQAKLAPNVMVDLGSNPNSTWEPVKIDSSAIAQFPNNYGLMKSQLLNQLSSPDTSISADVGNPGFSKTSAGVKNREQVLNVDDNYIRKQAEQWLEKVFETQLNLYFANKKGVEEVQLDQDTADDIRDIPNVDPNLVSKDNKIRIDYDTETQHLNFKIDPGSSEIKDDQQEVAELKEIIADVNQNPYSIQYIQQAGKELQLGEVYKQLFEKLGLKNLDKILTDVPKDANGQAQVTPPMAIDKPKLTVHYADLSPTGKQKMLMNAGIQVDPQEIAQYDAAKTAADHPAESPQDHPIIKLMTALKIDFSQLPQDSQEEVLRIIGIPTQMLTPTSTKLALDATDQQHQLLQGMEGQQNTQQGQQLAQAQHEAGVQQNQQQNALAQQQQDATVNQNMAQNNLQAQSQQQETENAAEEAGETPQQETQEPPTTGNPSDNLTAQDHQYIGKLQALGVPDQMIGQALAMLHHGVDWKQVLKMIQQAVTQNG